MGWRVVWTRLSNVLAQALGATTEKASSQLACHSFSTTMYLRLDTRHGIGIMTWFIKEVIPGRVLLCAEDGKFHKETKEWMEKFRMSCFDNPLKLISVSKNLYLPKLMFLTRWFDSFFKLGSWDTVSFNLAHQKMAYALSPVSSCQRMSFRGALQCSPCPWSSPWKNVLTDHASKLNRQNRCWFSVSKLCLFGCRSPSCRRTTL